jgi:hypothetical protein
MAGMAATERNGMNYTISIKWSTEDVQQERPDLLDWQAAEVLDAVKNKHDAETGVNWAVINYWADELFPVIEGEAS